MPSRADIHAPFTRACMYVCVLKVFRHRSALANALAKSPRQELCWRVKRLWRHTCYDVRLFKVGCRFTYRNCLCFSNWVSISPSLLSNMCESLNYAFVLIMRKRLRLTCRPPLPHTPSFIALIATPTTTEYLLLRLCLLSAGRLRSRLVLHFPPGFEPAMQMDLNIGRDTAVDWTLGEIVRLGLYRPSSPRARSANAALCTHVTYQNRLEAVKALSPYSLA